MPYLQRLRCRHVPGIVLTCDTLVRTCRTRRVGLRLLQLWFRCTYPKGCLAANQRAGAGVARSGASAKLISLPSASR